MSSFGKQYPFKPLLSLGVAGAVSAYNLFRRSVVPPLSREAFPTDTMSYRMASRYPARRVSGRRVTKKRYNKTAYAKPGMSLFAKRFVRTTNNGQVLSVAAGTTAFISGNLALSTVQTSDLTPVYRLYRIRKVVLHLVPRVDPANSGLANNFQAMIAAACDPESTAVPAAITAITAYDNSYQKHVVSGDRFRYTFYPKVTNSVDISGTATAAGSYSMNPWLRLDATGITVPHLSLKLGVQVSSATTVSFDAFYEFHFDVKGIA